MATSALRAQNFFSTTLSSSISASDTVIPLNAVPTGTEGFLIIEPDNPSNREIIYYTSKTGSGVVLTSAIDGRGKDGTTATSHSSGATVKLHFVNAYWEALRDGTSLADGSVTPLKLNLTKSTDANSWKTYDYGNFKKYIKTFSVNVGLSGGTRADVGDLGSPVGSPTTHVSGIAWQGTFAGHAIVGIQGNDIYLGNGTGSTLTFTGTITVELTDA